MTGRKNARNYERTKECSFEKDYKRKEIVRLHKYSSKRSVASCEGYLGES